MKCMYENMNKGSDIPFTVQKHLAVHMLKNVTHKVRPLSSIQGSDAHRSFVGSFGGSTFGYAAPDTAL